MNKTFQLRGERPSQQLPLAQKALTMLRENEEMTIFATEKEIAESIKRWAEGQGFTVTGPRNSGSAQWELTAKRESARAPSHS